MYPFRLETERETESERERKAPAGAFPKWLHDYVYLLVAFVFLVSPQQREHLSFLDFSAVGDGAMRPPGPWQKRHPEVISNLLFVYLSSVSHRETAESGRGRERETERKSARETEG